MAKAAVTPEKLAAADQRLAQSQARLTRQAQIVRRLRARGLDSSLAEQLLHEHARALELLHESRRLLVYDFADSSRAEAERQRLLEQVEREPTFLEVVLQHLPAGVLIVAAPSGRVLFYNGHLSEVLGRAEPSGAPSTPDRRNGRFPFDRALARAVARGEVAPGSEVAFKRRDGTRGIAAVHTAPVRTAAGEIIAQVAVFQDLTERKAAEARIRRLALHDPLTGLPNRALLLDRLGQALAHARREGGLAAVFLLDLDRFKEINDTLGHPVGDQLLGAVASRIAGAVRASDTLARLGGDEFALVQPKLTQPADAAALAAKILGTFAAPFQLDGHEVHVATSIGIALFPQDGPDPDVLLKNADLALYRAKAQGRDRFRLFEPAMDEEAQARRRLERELRQALERGEFVLHYQPQLELATGRFAGVEALVRWHHPERGLVPPGAFIPAAEASGLIRPLGAWVLREACRQANAWHGRGWELSVAVNLSPAQLRQNGVLPMIGEALAATGLEPARLELEITEGVLMENVQHKGDGFLRGLAADGVRLAIDDFGTGYSSLAYLKHLPVDTIKIDRSFVRDLGRHPRDEALVRGIVMLGQSLGKRVVAEGVENATQLSLLRELGCDQAQGFFIARPQRAEQFEPLLGG